VLDALQLEQAESLTWTDTPLANVAPHVLLLLLEAASLKLQAYAPTYTALVHPPYEFAPSDLSSGPSPLVLTALLLEQPERRTITDISLAVVDSHVLLLLLRAASFKLQEYDPTYKTLIDPPYELTAKVCCMKELLLNMRPVELEAVQLEQAESLTWTDTPLADVAPHVLLLLLEAASLKLQAYDPIYNTLIEPPYEFAP
jgi:hypothetical protein